MRCDPSCVSAPDQVLLMNGTTPLAAFGGELPSAGFRGLGSCDAVDAADGLGFLADAALHRVVVVDLTPAGVVRYTCAKRRFRSGNSSTV